MPHCLQGDQGERGEKGNLGPKGDTGEIVSYTLLPRVITPLLTHTRHLLAGGSWSQGHTREPWNTRWNREDGMVSDMSVCP